MCIVWRYMYLTCIGVYRCQDTLKYVLRVNSGTFESKCRCSQLATRHTSLPRGTHRLCFKAAPTSACPAHARDLVDCVSSLWYPGFWSCSSPTRAAPSYTRAACRDSWCVGWWNLGAAGGLDCGRWAAPRAEGSGRRRPSFVFCLLSHRSPLSRLCDRCRYRYKLASGPGTTS